jgi:hypothetical protein
LGPVFHFIPTPYAGFVCYLQTNIMYMADPETCPEMRRISFSKKKTARVKSSSQGGAVIKPTLG